MIEHGSRVTLQYELYDSNNELVDSNKDLGPLTITLGDKQLLPAVELALAGHEKGDSLSLALEAKDAFGPVINTAFKPIELELLPEDYRVVNAIFGINDDNGQPRQVRIDAIEDSKAILDFNHPLAGQDVRFELYVVDVE